MDYCKNTKEIIKGHQNVSKAPIHTRCVPLGSVRWSPLSRRMVVQCMLMQDTANSPLWPVGWSSHGTYILTIFMLPGVQLYLPHLPSNLHTPFFNPTLFNLDTGTEKIKPFVMPNHHVWTDTGLWALFLLPCDGVGQSYGIGVVTWQRWGKSHVHSYPGTSFHSWQDWTEQWWRDWKGESMQLRKGGAMWYFTLPWMGKQWKWLYLRIGHWDGQKWWSHESALNNLQATCPTRPSQNLFLQSPLVIFMWLKYRLDKT